MNRKLDLHAFVNGPHCKALTCASTMSGQTTSFAFIIWSLTAIFFPEYNCFFFVFSFNAIQEENVDADLRRLISSGIRLNMSALQ